MVKYCSLLRFIYTRGAAEGANKLGIEGETVSLNDFPQEIQKLGATHAENFLCIYKNRL